MLILSASSRSIVLRTLKQQRLNDRGETLTFDQFSSCCLVRTYCADHIVADSACAATAYLSGIKVMLVHLPAKKG